MQIRAVNGALGKAEKAVPAGSSTGSDGPATMRTVAEFNGPGNNGPGNNGTEVRDGIAYEIRAGDVVVIPTGTGH
jgi:hypothetical protein